MKNETNQLIREISISFRRSAIAFFKLGIKEFHSTKLSEDNNFQIAIANLCISIELLFKSIITKNSIRDLYTNLPKEFQLYLSKPDLIPDANTFRKFSIDMRNSNYKTIEFNDCTSLFYIFYPKEKQKYRPYLSLLSNIRNSSIHAFLPKIQSYDLSKVAFLCIELFNLVVNEGELQFENDLLEKNKHFINGYNEERVERVRKSIENAKQKAKNLDHTGSKIYGESWDSYISKCPVCQSDVLLFGFTEAQYIGEDGLLDFYADSFQCNECGLKLDDFDELKLAGLEICYNREESIFDFYKDNPPIYDFE